MSNDWEQLRDGLKDAIGQQLVTLVDGSIEDVQGPVRDAANRLVVAIRRGPAGLALVAEIKDQLALALLEKQLAARAAYANTFDTILNVGLNLLFNGAVAGLGAVKPK